jgi:hypothetical protein
MNIDIYQMPAEESPAAALGADTLKAFRLQRSSFNRHKDLNNNFREKMQLNFT